MMFNKALKRPALLMGLCVVWLSVSSRVFAQETPALETIDYGTRWIAQLHEGERRISFEGHTNEVISLLFTPNLLAADDDDFTLQLYAPERADPIVEMTTSEPASARYVELLVEGLYIMAVRGEASGDDSLFALGLYYEGRSVDAQPGTSIPLELGDMSSGTIQSGEMIQYHFENQSRQLVAVEFRSEAESVLPTVVITNSIGNEISGITQSLSLDQYPTLVYELEYGADYTLTLMATQGLSFRFVLRDYWLPNHIAGTFCMDEQIVPSLAEEVLGETFIDSVERQTLHLQDTDSIQFLFSGCAGRRIYFHLWAETLSDEDPILQLVNAAGEVLYENSGYDVLDMFQLPTGGVYALVVSNAAYVDLLFADADNMGPQGIE